MTRTHGQAKPAIIIIIILIASTCLGLSSSRALGCAAETAAVASSDAERHGSHLFIKKDNAVLKTPYNNEQKIFQNSTNTQQPIAENTQLGEKRQTHRKDIQTANAGLTFSSLLLNCTSHSFRSSRHIPIPVQCVCAAAPYNINACTPRQLQTIFILVKK